MAKKQPRATEAHDFAPQVLDLYWWPCVSGPGRRAGAGHGPWRGLGGLRGCWRLCPSAQHHERRILMPPLEALDQPPPFQTKAS